MTFCSVKAVSEAWCESEQALRREERLPPHPEPQSCSTATPRPRQPRGASAASAPPAQASKKRKNGEAPAQHMDPGGWFGVCSSCEDPWHMATPLATLHVPGAGGLLQPGTFMGTVGPRGASHLQTCPFGALQPPVQHSKISKPFNEVFSKTIPLKSLRPWQQLTQDLSSLLLFY